MWLRIIMKKESSVHNRLLHGLQAVGHMRLKAAETIAAIMLAIVLGAFPAAAESGKTFSLHTASYKTEKGASSDVRHLREKGYGAYFRKVSIPGKGVWYRVYAGSYESREKAAKAAGALKKSGIASFVSIERQQKPAEVKEKAVAPAKNKKEAVKSAPEKKKEETQGKKPASAAVKAPDAAENGKRAKAADNGKGLPVSAKVLPPPPEKKQIAENRPQASTTSVPAVPAKTTEPAAVSPVPSGNPLYDEAMKDFQAGLYEKAANNLKKLHAVKQTDPVLREHVLRRLADAFFFLGEMRGKQDYFNAVDYYKQILNDYPDPRPGNDLVYDRLSKCNWNLKFYYEAVQSLERLTMRYPESPYVPDALFRSAEILSLLGKLKEAIDKSQVYVNKYPEGAHAKKATFIIADCYYRLSQPENAETWYAQAQKKWSDLSDLPKYIIIDFGYHKYRYRKFSDAVDVFSYYISLYPADAWTKPVMLAMARSLAEMNQEATALKVYSQVMERYPESREAMEASVAMAALGVEKPGIRLPLYLAGVDNYQEPIIAYGLMLKKNPERDVVELILNQRSIAFAKIGRYRESIEVCLELLRQYPQGAYRNEALKNFKANALYLVNESYGKSDYVAVSDLYYRVAYHGMTKDMDFDTLFKVGDSLKMIGLYNDALSVFNDLSKMSTTLENETRTIIAMAEIEKMLGRDKEAEQKLLGILNQSKQKDSKAYRAAKAIMADIMYNRGSYDSAIESYKEALMKSGENEETLSAYENYADALKAKNMCSQASANYKKVIDAAGRNENKYPARMIAGAYMGMGDCLFKEKKFDEGMAMYEKGMKYITADDRKMWSVYRVAQEAMKASNYPLAEKSFAQLKASSDSAFWTKIGEYTVESGKWSEKHAEYLKNQ